MTWALRLIKAHQMILMCRKDMKASCPVLFKCISPKNDSNQYIKKKTCFVTSGEKID